MAILDFIRRDLAFLLLAGWLNGWLVAWLSFDINTFGWTIPVFKDAHSIALIYIARQN